MEKSSHSKGKLYNVKYIKILTYAEYTILI